MERVEDSIRGNEIAVIDGLYFEGSGPNSGTSAIGTEVYECPWLVVGMPA